jgi:bifunctional non-homologous end joining protein LigD
MKAVAGEVPTDDAGWAFEIKWDGMRVTSILGGDEPVAVSTNGRDVVGRFPELRLLNDHLGGHRVALDGEIVILDDQGRSDFGRLQPRMQAGSDAAVARLLGDGPATYVVFDLLAVGDLATVELPYVERRRLLADLLQDGPTWRVPEHRIGGGNDLFEAAAATGLEGIMAKRVDSPYLPGRRSSSWRKCKVRHRQEFVVGGWTRGEGTRGSTFGSLHVGYRDPSAPGSPLRYAGRVGSGLTDADLRHLKALLAPLRVADCPFDPPPPPELARASTWVRPEIVVEVAFANWTDAGNIRAPVHLGLRDDRDPTTVVREPTP